MSSIEIRKIMILFAICVLVDSLQNHLECEPTVLLMCLLILWIDVLIHKLIPKSGYYPKIGMPWQDNINHLKEFLVCQVTSYDMNATKTKRYVKFSTSESD